MDKTVIALSAAASPRATLVRRTLALAATTCAGVAAAEILSAGPRGRSRPGARRSGRSADRVQQRYFSC